MAKKVAVPSVVGTTLDAAETALTDAGLSVVKRYVAGEPDGTVYSQAPAPGKAAKGRRRDHRHPSGTRCARPGQTSAA